MIFQTLKRRGYTSLGSKRHKLTLDVGGLVEITVATPSSEVGSPEGAVVFTVDESPEGAFTGLAVGGDVDVVGLGALTGLDVGGADDSLAGLAVGGADDSIAGLAVGGNVDVAGLGSSALTGLDVGDADGPLVDEVVLFGLGMKGGSVGVRDEVGASDVCRPSSGVVGDSVCCCFCAETCSCRASIEEIKRTHQMRVRVEGPSINRAATYYFSTRQNSSCEKQCRRHNRTTTAPRNSGCMTVSSSLHSFRWLLLVLQTNVDSYDEVSMRNNLH